MRAGIIGIGSYKPSYCLTNERLEEMVETSDEWIIERTGMKNRPISGLQENVYVMGAMASLRAIYSAKLKVDQIDAIIGCTNTGLFAFPNFGSVIQYLIGAKEIPSWELGAGCSAQLYGLNVADALVRANSYKNVLVVASDALSTNVDYEDRDTCVLLSDIASAFVVSNVEKGGVLSTVGMSNGSLGPLLYRISGIGNQVTDYEKMRFSTDSITTRPYLVMDGKKVFAHAVRTMSELSKKALELVDKELEKENRRLDMEKLIVVPHHANQRIIDATVERLGISKEKAYCIIDEIGNSSAGSVGYAFEDGLRKEKIKVGDCALLVVFGAGLTGAAAVVQVTSGAVDYTKNIPDNTSEEVFRIYDSKFGSILPTTVEGYEKRLIDKIRERRELEGEIYPHRTNEEIPLNGLSRSARLRKADRYLFQAFDDYRIAAKLKSGYTLAHFVLDHMKHKN